MRNIVLLSLVLFTFTHVNAQDQPVYQWDFNSERKISATDSLAGLVQFVDGVRGQALVIDGYTTELVRTASEIGLPQNEFTISAWVAPQEYSWNLSAIVNQQEDLEKGYFFGINHEGKLVGAVAGNGKWNECIADHALPLLRWSFVSMTFDPKEGITLFIDGIQHGRKSFSAEPEFAVNESIVIGKTQTKLTPAFTERETSRAVVSWMYFDGLIDEVKIYGKALDAVSISREFSNTEVAEKQPLKFRQMPSGTDEPRPFGAYYTRLEYAPGWDARWQGSDLPDVIVRFDDSPVKLVFWRGTGYIPALVTENGIWMTDQSGENWGPGECFEAMGDKQCRYSHVRIIENTPARVVVHWRYALANISHDIKFETESYPGDWMDEYWIAYPDGVVVRKQVLWSEYKDPSLYQFQETIFFNQPGTKPQDNVEYDAITFLDMKGNEATYSWIKGAPENFDKPVHKVIEMVNTKSEYRPFSIHHPDRDVRPFRFGWIDGYSTFPCWNHWPVSQIASDGRNAVAPDKPSHSSLTVCNGKLQQVERFDDGSVRVRILMGMTKGSAASLLPLTKSWNNPPEVKGVSEGYQYVGYDQYERAFIFEKNGSLQKPLTFEISGSKDHPIVNIPVVIKNWSNEDASVVLDGKNLEEGQGYAQGQVRTLEENKLVVWINHVADKKVDLMIR